MSFSTDVKEDILKFNTDASARLVELESLLRFGSEVVLGRPLKLNFSCSSLSILRHFLELIKQFYTSIKYEVVSREQQKLKHQVIYTCQISEGAVNRSN